MHIKKLLSEDGIKMNQGIIKKQKDYERSTWWLPKEDATSSQSKMAHWVKLADIRYGRKQIERKMCKDGLEDLDKEGKLFFNSQGYLVRDTVEPKELISEEKGTEAD